ncbi:hypothetical protein POTOM_017982 [Populus tomentosa]|uniref:Protein kinase domain-containing protein n=1 Tax=Populus tomentosa TaxID=118781 RepID=A0A8X8D588_POPTO|nr:hypothetical protein POTOM_017982 [Populus tomentosa]
MFKHIERRKCVQLKKLFFKRNGGLLLQQQLSSSDGSVQKTKIFSSNELEKATDYFNENRILGHGGQGTVYKGMLPDGSIVAVKRSTTVDEEKLEEFINEVVILSQINHRNVVRLHGCCLETDVPLLVYEFIPNGTLSQYLHEQNEDFTLSWESRLRIASEAAGAISYLHSTASIPIYHRDIKSTNILLDEKYRAKVSDFGTSRSVSIDQTHLTTKVQGTFGYLDPEYFRTSQLTGKSDVYSFGVVLVELLSGKKPIFLTHSLKTRSLAEHFIELMEDSRLFDIIDAQVKGDCTEEEAIVIANLAKRCLNMNGKNRPTMREVAMELEGILLSRNGINTQQMVEVDISSRSISCSTFEIGTDVPLDCKPLISSETWVASEAALALDYLHPLADPPVIHGDVKSVNILLDNNYTTKVADFGASVLMSPGQTNILATKIQGTLGYLDPEYLMTGILTVQSDVYSFGVTLVELLTGEMPNSLSKSKEKRIVIQHFISALENNHLFKILDFQTVDEGEMDEIEVVVELAKGCLNSMGVNRPTMKEVFDELAKMKALHQKSLAQQNSEETEHLLGESSQSFCKNASPPMDQSQTVISLQIENYTNNN